MKKILYTTTAFILCGIAQSQAACISTPSCTSLGYGSGSSCEGGLKCPFGNYWYCPEEIIKGGECAEFPYTCFGRGYNEGQGIGKDCNGKYVKCTCYDGFEWQDGKGCIESSTECKIGAILHSDMTCSSSGYDSSHGIKTAIGIVIYSDGKGHGQALALKSIGQYAWSKEYGNIPELTDYESPTSTTDYASCENSKIIMAAGDKSKYPAVWAAHEYNTEGTKAGDWCLPAAGILNSYNDNKSAIETGIKRADGLALETIWTSIEYPNKYNVWYFDGNYFGSGDKKDYKYIRPVLEF